MKCTKAAVPRLYRMPGAIMEAAMYAKDSQLSAMAWMPTMSSDRRPAPVADALATSWCTVTATCTRPSAAAAIA